VITDSVSVDEDVRLLVLVPFIAVVGFVFADGGTETTRTGAGEFAAGEDSAAGEEPADT